MPLPKAIKQLWVLVQTSCATEIAVFQTVPLVDGVPCHIGIGRQARIGAKAGSRGNKQEIGRPNTFCCLL